MRVCVCVCVFVCYGDTGGTTQFILVHCASTTFFILVRTCTSYLLVCYNTYILWYSFTHLHNNRPSLPVSALVRPAHAVNHLKTKFDLGGNLSLVRTYMYTYLVHSIVHVPMYMLQVPNTCTYVHRYYVHSTCAYGVYSRRSTPRRPAIVLCTSYIQ